MRYRPRHRTSETGRLTWIQPFARTAGAVLGLVLVFVVAVYLFRSEEYAPPEPAVDSIADVLTPDPISLAMIEGAIDTESREGKLVFTNGDRAGRISRGEKDDHYYLEVEATLPEIDRELQYYQVWLISALPYDYFSLGEMVTNDDGVFVFEWDGDIEKTYDTYTQVLITQNTYEGSADPEVRIAQGMFGE